MNNYSGGKYWNFVLEFFFSTRAHFTLYGCFDMLNILLFCFLDSKLNDGELVLMILVCIFGIVARSNIRFSPFLFRVNEA